MDSKQQQESANQCRVKFQGRWFDVENFIGKHPGGSEILRKVSGKDVDHFLSGECPLDGVKHKHSANGYRILKKYAEDEPAAKSDVGVIDLGKPVMSQIGQLGEAYWDWIHSPIEKDLRMFESDWLEFLTRNQWYVIPALWFPLVLIFGWMAYGIFSTEQGSLSALATVGSYFCCGILVWTLMEYTLHRFAFHWKPPPNSPKMIVFHFILHGLHHKTPMDGGRLVFPPPMAICMVVFLFFVYKSILIWPVCLAVGAGNLFGYVCYDMTHYYLHHGVPAPGSYMHHMKGYHHAHHFKNPDLGYGITSVLWDIPFGTVGATT